MRTSIHQGENERQQKKGQQEQHQSSIKHVTRKFLEVSRRSHAKRWQRNVQIYCATHAKLFLC